MLESMCHGMPHTVVNALQPVLPGTQILISWLTYSMTVLGNQMTGGGGGGG